MAARFPSNPIRRSWGIPSVAGTATRSSSTQSASRIGPGSTFSGLPHTEALRITERIRRTAFGYLEIEETINDPGVFTRPFTVKFGAQYVPDTELLEFVCAENEKSHAHNVGAASDLVKRDSRWR
jgi:hypothetical protein